MSEETLNFILWFDIGWLIGLIGLRIYLYLDERQKMSKKSRTLKELAQLLEIKEKLYKALTKGIRYIRR